MNPAGWYRGKNILVTGGAGFIGSHLAQALAWNGAKVRIVDDLSAGTLENIQDFRDAVEFQKGDIREENVARRCVSGMEIIFHLAANASVPRSVENPRDDFARNALGTLCILQAAREHAVRQVVFASSGAVYGQPDKFPIVETEAILPISPYGASKSAGEAMCRAFNASYGMCIKIARIFNTFGPKQPRFVMFDFYHKLRRDPRCLEILGNGRQIRDYCFVEDTVQALLRLGSLNSGNCEAYNISSGQSYSVIEVARALVEIMGLQGVEFHFAGRSWPGDAQRWEVSIEKLASAANYRPVHDLYSGLACFIEWFDAHPERITA